jgi:hypothetical protein
MIAARLGCYLFSPEEMMAHIACAYLLLNGAAMAARLQIYKGLKGSCREPVQYFYFLKHRLHLIHRPIPARG